MVRKPSTAFRLKSCIKRYGGKSRLTKAMLPLVPSHTHYVEPFFGSGALFFAKPHEGVSEVINDLDGMLANFWVVVQSQVFFPEFIRNVSCIPFSETHFNWHKTTYDLLMQSKDTLTQIQQDRLGAAISFFVTARMSHLGQCKQFAALSRTRTRRGMNEQASAWWSAVDYLDYIHQRLRGVVILNRCALNVIHTQDGEDTFFYCDPPYVHETRRSRNNYDVFEMSDEQHEDLLNRLSGIRGKFMLSGYRNEMYDSYAKRFGWFRHDVTIANNASSKSTKPRKTESLWCNYAGSENNN